MNDRSSKQFFRFIILIILTCFSIELLAATSAGDYDYSHRKRDCEITVIAPGGEPFAGTLLGIELLQNDFAFGGTIRYEGFDSIGDEYGAWFSNYFDIATPENEMKWEFAMKCSQKCDPDFSKADSLIAWLSDKKIPVRGNNLFSNEKVERIPEWTRNLGKTEFKQAMLERISTAMEHFRGKVELWDLINEICHGEDGSLLSNNMLETRSGDPNILGWIMDEARKKDTSANFIINDFAIATSSDQAAADKFINKLKPLSSKFQIVGAKGHFSTRMDKNSWEPKINYLAQQLGKPVWLTDLDFSVDINQAPEKMEELMRTCFANPKVTGLTIKSWCGALKTHSNFSSLFIDSLKTETPVGERWREVRDEWKTDSIGYTDDSGKFTFNGFQGKYLIGISCYADTFYLEPGESTKKIMLTYGTETAVDYKPSSLKTIKIVINDITVPIKIPVQYNRRLFLTTWSLSGQCLSRTAIDPKANKCLLRIASTFCRVFRLETAEHFPLYTGKITPAR